MTNQIEHTINCDICDKNKAKYDSKSIYGCWAYMCVYCAKLHSIGIKTDLDKAFKK